MQVREFVTLGNLLRFRDTFYNMFCVSGVNIL